MSVVYCMFVYMYDFSFFFFKQKTAYEMRISDWSSDVCSSDLFEVSFATTALALISLFGIGTAVAIAGAVITILDRRRSGKMKQFGDTKIGRASCRERVCQYV